MYYHVRLDYYDRMLKGNQTKYAFDFVPENKIEELKSRQCIKRLGTFEDVKNVIDFYLKPESNFITGQVVYLGGVF